MDLLAQAGRRTWASEGDKTPDSTVHSVACSLTGLWAGDAHCGKQDDAFQL